MLFAALTIGSAAFCFYNLSSIVNGLVYFNQFSLIPPLHLWLVSLGIFILLCGVWIVSIQPGSRGGVDVGPWSEEGVTLPGEDLAIYSRPEDEEINRRRDETPTSQSRVRIGPVPMERETLSESNLQTLASPPKPIGLGIVLGPGGGEERLTQSSILPLGKRKRAETSLYSGPRVAPHRRPTGDPSLHVRTMSHPAQIPSSPSVGTVSTISTGFQIGLSPLSPGFTILPLERRRRPSGMQSGVSFADVAGEVVGNIHRQRRRTVSEGETSSRTARGEIGERGTENSDEETSAGRVGEADLYRARSACEDGRIEDGRRGWRWLRGIFRSKE